MNRSKRPVSIIAQVTNTEQLLTPAEVATLFRVDPKTVARWAKSGKLQSIRTPGGHHRFPQSIVSALLSHAGLAETVNA
jgi:excisionase family DNA binding protein